MPALFDRQPTLSTDTLIFRPLRPDDFDGLYAVACDALLWEQHHEPTRHELPVFKRFFDAAIELGGALTACDREDHRIVGSSRFHGYDPDAAEIEIGWSFLGRRSWGGPTNRDMKRLMLDHAFQVVDAVILKIGHDNKRSQRVVEKLGAVDAGAVNNPQQRPGVIYRLTKQTDAQLQA
jgi:N-acetyltransferase